MKKVLIIEDEKDLAELLAFNLEKEGYTAACVHNGKLGLERAAADPPDLILLDLMLPGIDGLEVCRELRKTSSVPIIMITARGEEIDRVVGLELGADDYVSKPFSLRELMARIKAVLRRVGPGEAVAGTPRAAVLRVGGLSLDPDSRQASLGEAVLPLTRLEFDLLYLLALNPGRVLARERLLEQAWGYDFEGEARAVDSTVKRLRAKLRAAHPDADRIEAVRGIGYRLKA